MSSADRSHLTFMAPSFDMVVATTQYAIDATMKLYLSSVERKPTSQCWCLDDNDNLQAISLDDFIQRYHVDPFEVDPAAKPAIDAKLQNLADAGFKCGYKLTPGLPIGVEPTALPHIVELGGDTSVVTYNMLCSEVDVRFIDYGRKNNYKWRVFSQPPGEAWAFQSKVDLRLSETLDSSAFSKLSPEVQKQIKNLDGNAFSVQQLLFDLDNAALQTPPAMKIFAQAGTTVDPIISGLINGSFCDTYYAEMKSQGQPMLHVAVVEKVPETSEFRATDMNMQVCPFVDESDPDATEYKPKADPTEEEMGLATLNYLCTSFGNKLPPPRRFPWNWVSMAESKQWDGVIAYNRDTFVKWLQPQFMDHIYKNCYYSKASTPIVNAKPEYNAVTFSLAHRLTDKAGPEDPHPEFPSGNTMLGWCSMSPLPWTKASDLVLDFKYTPKAASHDVAGLNGILGEMSILPSYTFQVSFRGRQVTIVQRLRFYVHARHLRTPLDGNLIDWELTDTYELKVDGEGGLLPELHKGSIVDRSEKPSVNSVLDTFTGLNGIIDRVTRQLTSFTNADFVDFPLATARQFVFPGGRTFAFRDFKFSKFQDLTAGITYVDPTASPQ